MVNITVIVVLISSICAVGLCRIVVNFRKLLKQRSIEMLELLVLHGSIRDVDGDSGMFGERLRPWIPLLLNDEFVRCKDDVYEITASGVNRLVDLTSEKRVLHLAQSRKTRDAKNILLIGRLAKSILGKELLNKEIGRAHV